MLGVMEPMLPEFTTLDSFLSDLRNWHVGIFDKACQPESIVGKPAQAVIRPTGSRTKWALTGNIVVPRSEFKIARKPLPAKLSQQQVQTPVDDTYTGETAFLHPDFKIIRKPLPARLNGRPSSARFREARDPPSPPDVPLPEKHYNRLCRNSRWTLFSVYRRLCLLVIAANVIAMISTRNLFKLSESVTHISTAVSVNLAVAVLMRQELVVNLLFVSIGQLPHRVPLKLRHLAAKVYHYGGIHSGAGISAFLWFLIFNNAVSKLCRRLTRNYKIGILFLISVIDVLLTLIIIFAEPRLRARLHNVWEVTHRFAGWTCIAAFWILFGLLATVQGDSIGHVFVHSPTFWCLLIITISLILPWLQLRRVPVEPIRLSDHAVRLSFDYTHFPAGAAQKLSDNGLREFHPFAGISGLDESGFSMLISRAGDWTEKTIKDPPRALWKRGMPTRGVISVAAMFKRVVFVATGSGIGPVLSILGLRDRFVCRIIWSTRDPETTYQQEIIDFVKRADPEAIIFNTSEDEQPDLVRETYQLYRSHDAEAVFVISNPKVTRKVIYGLECRGVPIFGVIFDS